MRFAWAFFIGRADFERAAAEYETALRLNPQAGWSALQLAHCAALRRDFARGEAAAAPGGVPAGEDAVGAGRGGHRGVLHAPGPLWPRAVDATAKL